MTHGRGWLGALLLAVAAVPAVADPLLDPAGVAGVEGAASAFVNPAALGTRYPGELWVARDADAGGRPWRWRAAASHGGFGVAVNQTQQGPRSVRLAFAGGGRGGRAGWSVASVRGAAGGRVVDHAFGVLARPAPWLSAGATAAHLGTPRLDGARLERRYTAGVAWRPLALVARRAHDLGHRLTLGSEWSLAENQSPEESVGRWLAELELVPGLSIRAAGARGGSLQVGFSMLGPRQAVHATAAYDGNERRTGHGTALSLHAGEDRTVFVSPRARRLAEIRVGGVLGDDALAGVSLFGGPATTPVAGLHRELQRALEDPLTRGVLLDLRGVSNMAQIEELRPRIARLRAAGKPVVAALEYGGGRGDLYLAAACDRIVASEDADFAALGLRTERRYYKGALAALGLRLDRVSVGDFKSAYRNFSADSTPPSDREVIEHTLDRAQDLFVAAVAADRRMDRTRLESLLDGRMWPASNLLAAGLVDSLGDLADARRLAGRLAGLGDKPRRVRLAGVPVAERAWRVPRPVAVVYAAGAIGLGRSGSDVLNGPYIGPETIIPQLERAFRDPAVRAVVLRIESPGGSSLGTSLIHRAAERLRRVTGKPLIVSMGSMAASGGYQLALAGDRIFASQHTRTGSIGVVFVRPSLQGFYDRHGVRQDAFERGDRMGAWSTGRDWDARDHASADSAIGVTYAAFKGRVARARGLDADAVEPVARGRVWMAGDALRHGLIDEIGGFEAAVAEARRRAGVPEGTRIELVEYRRPRPPWIERLVGGLVRESWGDLTRLPDPGGIELRADTDDE